METIQPPSKLASTIQVDKDYDNHAAEFLTVTIFLNSAKGQQLKRKEPLGPDGINVGIANVKLHGLEHKEILQAMMPQPMPAQPAPAGPKTPHAAPPQGAAPPKPAGAPNPAPAGV